MLCMHGLVLVSSQVKYMNQVLDAGASQAPSTQGRQGLGLELTNQRSVSSVLTGPSEHDLRPQEIADAGLKVCPVSFRNCFLCVMQTICPFADHRHHSTMHEHATQCMPICPEGLSQVYWFCAVHGGPCANGRCATLHQRRAEGVCFTANSNRDKAFVECGLLYWAIGT